MGIPGVPRGFRDGGRGLLGIPGGPRGVRGEVPGFTDTLREHTPDTQGVRIGEELSVQNITEILCFSANALYYNIVYTAIVVCAYNFVRNHFYLLS